MVAVVVCGATLGILQLRGPAPADGTGAVHLTSAATAQPDAVEPAAAPQPTVPDTGQSRPDPAAAAAELTVRRAQLLGGIHAEEGDLVGTRLEEVRRELATIHAEGASLAQDLALAERLLSGESTLPELTTEVIATSVANATDDAASVDVDYRIVDAWGTAQERRVRLGLVWAGEAWRTASVTAPPR